MEIPKHIQKKLEKRMKLAQELIVVSEEIDAWMEENGADFSDSDIADCVLTGCMIYCEPKPAKDALETYIRNKL